MYGHNKDPNFNTRKLRKLWWRFAPKVTIVPQWHSMSNLKPLPSIICGNAYTTQLASQLKDFFFHKIASRAPISSMKSLNEDYHHKISQAHLDLNLVVSLFISNFAGCYAPQPPLIQYHTKQGMKHVLIKQRRIMDIMAKIKKSM